jgi:hypothetical protein
VAFVGFLQFKCGLKFCGSFPSNSCSFLISIFVLLLLWQQKQQQRRNFRNGTFPIFNVTQPHRDLKKSFEHVIFSSEPMTRIQLAMMDGHYFIGHL